MKRRDGAFFSAISTAAVTTAALAMPVQHPVEVSAPIHRLASIRESYLATLPADQRPQKSAEDQIAQFKNFRNFSNWRNQ